MCTETRLLETTELQVCPQHKTLCNHAFAHRKCPHYKYIETRTKHQCEEEEAENIHRKKIAEIPPPPEMFLACGYAEDSDEVQYAREYHKGCAEQGYGTGDCDKLPGRGLSHKI